MIHPVTAVVLAGGAGTRARASGDRTPKVLRRVSYDETLLSSATARALAIAGEVLVAVGPIRSLLAQATPQDERIALVDDLGVGTGTALLTAALRAEFGDLLVLNADTLNDVAYGRFVEFHRRRGVGASILLSRWPRAQNPGSYAVGVDGTVLCSYEDGESHDARVSGEVWRGASMGALLFPTRELRSLSLIPTSLVERDITPLYIARRLLWGFDAGETTTLDLGVPLRFPLLTKLDPSVFSRRD